MYFWNLKSNISSNKNKNLVNPILIESVTCTLFLHKKIKKKSLLITRRPKKLYFKICIELCKLKIIFKKFNDNRKVSKYMQYNREIVKNTLTISKMVWSK